MQPSRAALESYTIKLASAVPLAGALGAFLLGTPGAAIGGAVGAKKGERLSGAAHTGLGSLAGSLLLGLPVAMANNSDHRLINLAALVGGLGGAAAGGMAHDRNLFGGKGPTKRKNRR